MNTTITYNGQNIDFGEDVDQLFCDRAKSEYLSQTFQLIYEMPAGRWMSLNTTDPNYFLLVKALVFIVEYRHDQRSGFCLEFNSAGRPFGKMRKINYHGPELKAVKNYFQKSIVHSYNYSTFVPLTINSETIDMAKKKTETAIALIEPAKATALFETVAAQLSIVVAKCSAVTVIETAEQAVTFTEDAKKLKALFDEGEKIRKEAKDPYLLAGKIIDKSHGEIFDPIEKLLATARTIIGAWNQKELAEKQKRDQDAAALRAEEDRKAELAKTGIGAAGVFLINLEKQSIEEIAAMTDRKQLGAIWKTNVAPYMNNFGQFGDLATLAEGVITRITAFGHAKDAVLTDPSPVKQQIFAIEKPKAIVAAQNAEREIYAAISAAQTAVTVTAEVAKSDITQTQIADKPEAVVAVRRSPIKYEVLDITLVPADFTMTVINEEYMKKVISEHGAAIDANPLLCPGIRFYRDETVKL